MTSPHLPHPPHPSTPPRRGIGRWIALVAIVALVSAGLGVLVGYLAFASTDEGDGGGARANAETACAIAARMDPDDPLGFDSEESVLESPEYGEMTAVYGLAQAAGAEDEAYADLGESGELIVQSYRQFDEDGIRDAFAELERACADLG